MVSNKKVRRPLWLAIFLSPLDFITQLLLSQEYFWTLGLILLLFEVVLNLSIIKYVPYTEIDWSTYMQQVEIFLKGERDYINLKGDTGPLVYPAGFIYIYSILYKLTDQGRNILRAQYIFAGLYIATMAIVFKLYQKSRFIPPYILIPLVLSKRLHSIYLLRLFNDPFAMFFLYYATLLLINRKYDRASIMISIALSIKMNILLFVPAFVIILLKARGVFKATMSVMYIILVQLIFGTPFLTTFPQSYLSQAFDFSRIFLYKWTVNWRFLPQSVFYSAIFHIALLTGHIFILTAFVFKRWLKPEGGLLGFLRHIFMASPQHLHTYSRHVIRGEHVLTLMFTSGLIGMLFARSLHYQFYSWIAHGIPFLVWHAWSTQPPTIPSKTWVESILNVMMICVRFGIMMASEWAWNVYPATPISSAVVIGVFTYILTGLWFAKSDEVAIGFGMLRSSSTSQYRKTTKSQ